MATLAMYASIKDPLHKSTLCSIPPSCQNLFEAEKLSTVLNKAGGVRKVFGNVQKIALLYHRPIKILHLSLSSWTADQIPTKRGENGSFTLHFDHYFRLPYPICQKAPTLYTRPKKFRPCHSGFCANDTNYTEDHCRKRSICSATVTQIPVTYVSGTKRRRDNEAHIQSQNIKSVCPGNAIQYDKHSQNTRVPTAERLASENKSFTSLFSPTDTQSTQALSTPLASVPKTFAALSNWMAQFLRQKGIRLIVYLDDYLIANRDVSTLKQHVTITIHFLEYLGWMINYEKSVLVPRKTIEYLGILWDPWQNRKMLAREKQVKLHSSISNVIRKPKTNIKQIQSLI
nr:uncharacterized protein LOC113400427 [Vanessa tameamea]